MQTQSTSSGALRALLMFVVLIVLLTFNTAGNAFGAVSASANSGMPFLETNHSVTGGFGSVAINESVALDLNFGPWIKHLINDSGHGYASGENVLITETFTNIGNVPWTDWHEEVRSVTFFDPNPNPQPGFLFRAESVQISANYGSGFVPLVQGNDYTIVPTLYAGPPIMDNPGNWTAMSIFLVPGREVAAGNTLRIQKNIFEIFGDADPWRPFDEALVAQYPTPEPAGAVLFAIGIIPAMLRRSRSAA